MKTFTLTDLKNHTGKVIDAAIREPVSLTKHGAEALVIMARDEYDRRMAAADARRAYATSELPPNLAHDLAASLAGVTAESYGDD